MPPENLSPYFEFPFDNYNNPPGSNQFANTWGNSRTYLPTGRAFLAPPSAPTPPCFRGVDAPNPLATPLVAPSPDLAADKLQAEGLFAGLDFFADNQGLVIYAETPARSYSDGEMGSHSLTSTHSGSGEGHPGFDDEMDSPKEGDLAARAAISTLEGDGENLHVRIIHRLRERMNQQEAYIAELEDSNLRYRETIDLLQHQLREMRE